MREISYKEFSASAHRRLLDACGPTDCRFELTFACDYRCRHCYTACFNRESLRKKELGTAETLAVLEKMRFEGVLWLCLSGGDPLLRPDFPEIYAAGRRLGFLITVLTNGYRITREIIRLWQELPPFAVEVTLNAVSEGSYDRISGAPGSFRRVRRALDLLQDAGLAVKLKMQVTTENVHELPRVRAWARGRGLPLEPSFLLHPRLNGDRTPCLLRVPLPEGAASSGRAMDCGSTARPSPKNPLLFPCAIGAGARWHVDPYGSGFLCPLWRKPKFDLLAVPLARARQAALAHARGLRYRGEAACPSCPERRNCISCPGLAYVETGDPEAVVPFYCALARTASGRRASR